MAAPQPGRHQSPWRHPPWLRAGRRKGRAATRLGHESARL